MQSTTGETERVADQVKERVISPGLVAAGVLGGLVVGTYCVAGPFLTPALRKICLPYVPASNRQVVNVMKALKGRSGTLVDLGSGDGRIVIEAARRGFMASGVELNRWLVLYSKWAAHRNKVGGATNFIRRDLWKFDLSPYNNVVVFGVEPMMEGLEKKCIQEMANDSTIVACRFSLPNLEPVLTVGTGIDTVWVYRIRKERT